MHGSFSMMVNYHAIAQFVRNMGGQALHPGHEHRSLNVSAFLLGRHPDDYPETRRAYHEAIEAFGPDDFFTLKEGIQKNYGALSLSQLLAFLRLSGWDAGVFYDCCPALLDGLAGASDAERQAVYEMTQRVWELYYFLGEAQDIPFQLGMVLYDLGHYAAALDFFQQSLQLHGPHPSTTYNIGLCHYGLKHMAQALHYIEETLDLDPAFEGAADMWRDLQAKMSERERT